MSSPEELNLASLPSDVIRKIFKEGQESLFSMRHISKRWNNIGIEHLRARKQLPVIKHLKFEIFNYKPLKSCKLVIEISKTLKHYFGLTGWNHASNAFASTHENLILEKIFPDSDEWFREHIYLLVRRCSVIEKFEIEFYDSTEINRWYCAIPVRVKIHELSINRLPSIDGDSVNEILNLIETYSIKRVIYRPLSTFSWTDNEIALSNLFDTVVDVASLHIIKEMRFESVQQAIDFWEARLGDLMESANCDYSFDTCQRDNQIICDIVDIIRYVQ